MMGKRHRYVHVSLPATDNKATETAFLEIMMNFNCKPFRVRKLLLKNKQYARYLTLLMCDASMQLIAAGETNLSKENMPVHISLHSVCKGLNSRSVRGHFQKGSRNIAVIHLQFYRLLSCSSALFRSQEATTLVVSLPLCNIPRKVADVEC